MKRLQRYATSFRMVHPYEQKEQYVQNTLQWTTNMHVSDQAVIN